MEICSHNIWDCTGLYILKMVMRDLVGCVLSCPRKMVILLEIPILDQRIENCWWGSGLVRASAKIFGGNRCNDTENPFSNMIMNKLNIKDNVFHSIMKYQIDRHGWHQYCHVNDRYVR